MTTIESFVNRLKKIGIEVELSSNYPWVYMDKVNGKPVQGRFESNHNFTVFFQPVRADQKEHITDITTVFKKIRQTLNGIKCHAYGCDGDLYYVLVDRYTDEDWYFCTKCNVRYNVSQIDN